MSRSADTVKGIVIIENLITWDLILDFSVPMFFQILGLNKCFL